MSGVWRRSVTNSNLCNPAVVVLSLSSPGSRTCMYLRIKRDRFTLFLHVEASDRVRSLKETVFASICWVSSDGATNDDKPVVGTVTSDAPVTSPGDFSLALCRCLPAGINADSDSTQEATPLQVETIMLGDVSLVDSKVENDDILCVVLAGEDPEDVFRRTMALDDEAVLVGGE